MKKYDIDTDPILSKLDVIRFVECEKCHSTIPYVYAVENRFSTDGYRKSTFYCGVCYVNLKHPSMDRTTCSTIF